MIEQSVASVEEDRAERMIRAFMEGAESGMIEARGYGLSVEEREAAELEAVALYGVSEGPENSEGEAA